MTGTYDDYKRALAEVRDLPARTAADLEGAQQTYSRAVALADRAVSLADTAAAATLNAVEGHLIASRATLEPLGLANLVPPAIRPSGGPRTATRDEMVRAEQSLAVAVGHVRDAVQTELERLEAENERRARDAAERERLAREAADRAAVAAARRRKLIRLGITGAVVLIVLVVILIFAL